MASEEQSMEKEEPSPSDPQTAPVQWGAILSAVKDQIPSMDSDISLSDFDDDGELFIFQRDETNLIPDLSEELEQLSLDEADLKETFMFMRHPKELWNEDLESSVSPAAESVPLSVCKEQVQLGTDDFGLLTDEKPSQPVSALSAFSTNGHKSGEGISGIVGEKDLCIGKGPAILSLSADILPVEASSVLNTSEKERRKLIETQILSKATLGPSKDVVHPPSGKNNNLDIMVKAEGKPSAISAEHPQELSLFAFKDLEKWDLDKILQSLEKQSSDRSWTEEIASPSIEHETGRSLSQARLMEKLEELCLKQSLAFFPRHRRLNKCQGDGRDVPILPSLTNGRSLTPVELQHTPEPPTIYIDLRDTASQKCPLPADEKQSSSDSSTDEEEDTKVTSQEPVKERLKEPSWPSRKDCTGKSFLLQQLRHFRRQIAQTFTTVQDKEMSKNLKNAEAKAQPKARRRRCLEWKGLASMGPPNLESKVKDFLDRVNSMGIPSGELQEESEGEPSSGSASESSEGKNARYSRAREMQEKKQAEEKLKKEKLQEQLERLKPQCSITGKQPMAEQTPVLFHTEASYLAPIKTLLTQKDAKRKMLLLTIRLSSCTQIFPCGQEQMPFPEISLFAANTYSAVVAWLLSLRFNNAHPLCLLPSFSATVLAFSLPGELLSQSPLEPTARKTASLLCCLIARSLLLVWQELPTVLPLIRTKEVPAEEESKAPFQVLGLQQAWHEEGLVLHACIVPAKKVVALSDSSLQKHTVKEFLPETSLFYQQTSMFLSRTLLSDVIWWKEELANQMQNQNKYPFLPEIPAIYLSCITTINSDLAAVEQAFAMPAGFYWQTVEADEEYFSGSSDIKESSGIDTEVAMTLLFETLLRNPVAVHHILQLILASGLDVCGLRLLYPEYSMLLSNMVPLPSSYTQDKMFGVLALSLRGAKARSILQDIMGPSDPQLAIVTDSCSMNAIYGTSRAEPLAYLPHTDHRVHRDLCVWFGGRVCCYDMLCDGTPRPVCSCDKARFLRPSSLQAEADPEKGDILGLAPSRPPATLVSTTKGDAILVVSPAVPCHAYGAVITTCTQRGFALQGVKRLRLTPKQTLLLCMAANQEAAFCPTKTLWPPDQSISGDHFAVQPHVHCLILLLRKENASHHAPALLKGLMNGLAEKGFLEEVQSRLSSCIEPDPGLCFHVVPYTDIALQTLGGKFSSVPDPCNIPLEVFCHRMYVSHPEMEQIVLLTLSGQEAMKCAGSFLHQILALGFQKQAPTQAAPPYHTLPLESWQEEDGEVVYHLHCSSSAGGVTLPPGASSDSFPNLTFHQTVPEEFDQRFELLALKWLPHLTRIQAKEITPFEVGDKSWQASIATLMSGPALVCALRRIHAFEGLAKILKTFALCDSKPSAQSCHLQAVMSPTPEIAFRQAVLFFTKKDFVDDPKCHQGLKYLPPPSRPSQMKGEMQRSHAESLFHYMQGGAPVFCTVLLIKPGIWPRNLARFLRKLDQEKFCLVGMKHIDLNPEDVRALLSPEAQQDLAVVEAHSSYLTSGSSLVLCLQRENAVKKLLDLLGPEDPKKAQIISQLLWRAQYGLNLAQNGFYGSMSYCVALRDIKMFFPEGLCGAECPTLEEKEICTVKFDPVVCLEINKQRRLVKRPTRRQLHFQGSEWSQTLEWPHLAVFCQTTCLIFPEILLHGAGRPPYLKLLEQLISKDFLVTGARLTMMNTSQASFISGILSATDCKLSVMRSQLMEGPCLVLAAQRDNAVICFDSLLTGDYPQKQAVLDLMQHLLYPKTEKQAEELLCCLFDSLTSESTYLIETKDS